MRFYFLYFINSIDEITVKIKIAMVPKRIKSIQNITLLNSGATFFNKFSDPKNKVTVKTRNIKK